MNHLYFVTHPEVVVDPHTPIERWHLSATGIDRMRLFSRRPELTSLSAIWSSAETKAIEAAGILAATTGLGVSISAALGENDRSATGFLASAEFETVADAFFAQPSTSIRGWEKAVDAQARVRNAVSQIVSRHCDGDLAIVAHGAVGTLLLCALLEKPISRVFDQPFQGHYWKASLSDLKPLDGWQPIAPRL
ncbi:MAG: histidine phosphatase family protein [Sphingomonas hengshuiensis]|uniref:Histidine phosphatase family protein n=1 Tax=Sphingomonas hengshuiensis TaxID=1609977 RepID=A0A2W5AY88_9SPHN|nr:MAG: histidine phosphatase family protein [Sphingomonas hengshuiensis]